MLKNQPNQPQKPNIRGESPVLLLAMGLALWAGNANAWTYLSGYSNTSSNAYSHGSYGRYYHPSHYGRSYGGSGNVTTDHTNPHTASIARKAEEKRLQKIRYAEYDKNPPCGTYGRLPKRCRNGNLNVAERN